MADFRVEVDIEAVVDEHGDAAITRVWKLTNLTDTTLSEFDNYRLTVVISSRDVQIKSLSGTPNCKVSLVTELVGAGDTAVHCDFEYALPPHEQLSLTLEYSHPRYFTRFPSAKSWVLAECFEKLPLSGKHNQEQPQKVRFNLIVSDPRGALFGVRSPLSRWSLSSTVQCAQSRTMGSSTLTYNFGLGKEDRTPDIYVLSALTGPSALIQSVSGALVAVAGAGLTALIGRL